jgi:uncharacterized protein (TIGR02996 family)
MTDEQALLQAVLAEPTDDVPRLVYADFLDETGEIVQMARAEFIRLQCEIARGAFREATIIRQHCLLADHQAAWLAPLKQQGEPFVGPSSYGQFRRGFVEVVWMRGNVFLQKAEKLFQRCPVLELRLTQVTVAEIALIVALPVMRKLQAFDLAFRGVAEAFVRAVTNTPRFASIQSLSLRNCGLSDDLAMRLADVPFDWNLQKLDVANNGGPGGLTSVGLSALQRRFGARVVQSNARN